MVILVPQIPHILTYWIVQPGIRYFKKVDILSRTYNMTVSHTRQILSLTLDHSAT